MPQIKPQISAAYCSPAATLSERLSALHASPENRGPADVERARRRLQAWKNQEPFNQNGYFERRLTIDQTTEDELLYLLGQRTKADDDPWVHEFESIFSAPTPSDAFPTGSLWNNTEQMGFLVALRPVIDYALHDLWIAARELAGVSADPPFDPQLVPLMLFPNLERRLQAMLKRVMVLELNVARLEGRLEGKSAAERFQSFLKILREKDVALKIFSEYPVLCRQILVRIEQWLEVSKEFLQHLCADWPAIKTLFFARGNPDLLTEVQGGVGDNHRNGRSVLICRFSQDLRLVYKPRSLALDAHFQDLLDWINERGSHPPFRKIKILNGHDYGWAEFITAGPCQSAEEVHRFYERQGGYLALLYALEASDCHLENVIAAGEHPMLIDLEALFHPHLPTTHIQDPAYALAGKSVDYSVLRVGLLPRKIFGNEESDGMDVSGLSGAGGQLTSTPVLSLDKEGTDEMRFVRQRVLMAGSNNLPTLSGVAVPVQDYGDFIIAGFTVVYNALFLHRHELAANDGPLTHFANDSVRVLLRPTQSYSSFLWETFHPDVLRDALDRDCLLDRLWTGVPHATYLERVIAAEKADLLISDVPIFTTQPSSCSLWNSRNEQYDHFFQQSGLSTVKERLLQLDSDDLSRQIWFIRASFTSLALAEPAARKTRRTVTASTLQVSSDQLLAHAIKVGERLKELALEGDGTASWVGVALVNERSWSVLPLGPKLYDGISGIALFLAYLGSVTGRDDYTQLSRRALVTLHHQLEQFAESAPVGAYSGLAGIIHALCHLGVLWNDAELLQEAEKLTRCLPAMIAKDTRMDIIGGSAGCLAVLLNLYQVKPSDELLATMLQCGNHLVDEARAMPQGIGWISKGVAEKPLTGFSHGAAGIAWALLKLAQLTGDDRFRKTACEALLHERSLFLPEANNWLDLRESEGDSAQNLHCGMTWCHGAPGIGLARLDMLGALDIGNFRTEAPALGLVSLESIRAEITIALETSLAQGFGSNHCLCHGDLGNLELLQLAASLLQDQRWTTELNRLTAITVESIESDGWLCGTPSNVETPGLMTGLAGIGYQLLRLADLAQVPSVLLLSPPARKRQGAANLEEPVLQRSFP